MINPRYLMPLAIVTMILEVVMVMALGRITPVEQTEALDQPEYIAKVFDKDSITGINIEIKQEDWDWLGAVTLISV